jgi:septal ring factor EnvC (AmiA/AmiB activator)
LKRYTLTEGKLVDDEIGDIVMYDEAIDLEAERDALRDQLANAEERVRLESGRVAEREAQIRRLMDTGNELNDALIETRAALGDKERELDIVRSKLVQVRDAVRFVDPPPPPPEVDPVHELVRDFLAKINALPKEAGAPTTRIDVGRTPRT